MITIQALSDQDLMARDLARLGELRGIKGVPAKTIAFSKRVSVAGAGSYRKTIQAPLYSAASMRAHQQDTPAWNGQNCLGMICPRGAKKLQPRGFVQRQQGVHLFRIPVFAKTCFSSTLFRVAGYLPTDTGFVTVIKRRTWFWFWLALAAVAAFGLSYLMFLYGPGRAFGVLGELFGSLAP